MPQMTLQTLTDSNLQVWFLFWQLSQQTLQGLFPNTSCLFYSILDFCKQNRNCMVAQTGSKLVQVDWRKVNPSPNPFIFRHSLGALQTVKKKTGGTDTLLLEWIHFVTLITPPCFVSGGIIELLSHTLIIKLVLKHRKSLSNGNFIPHEACK